jgi:hypothetical protein
MIVLGKLTKVADSHVYAFSSTFDSGFIPRINFLRVNHCTRPSLGFVHFSAR